MLRFDKHLTDAIRESGTSTLPLWRFLASQGMWAFIVASGVMICYGLVPWFDLLIPVFLTHFLTLGVQLMIRRPRPTTVDSSIHMWWQTPSFPSAHAAGSMAFAVALSAVSLHLGTIGIALTIFFLALAILIGLSRIMVGVHFLGDVLVGFLFGMIVVGMFLSVV